jgi:hypothetical protein
MINVSGWKSGSSYTDLTANNELKVKTQLGKTENCDAIQEEVSTWLTKRSYEKYFGHWMALKRGDEKCFSNTMYVLNHTSGAKHNTILNKQYGLMTGKSSLQDVKTELLTEAHSSISWLKSCMCGTFNTQMLLTALTGKTDVEIGITAGKMQSYSISN